MISDRLRREVIERAQNQCEYCRSQANFCPDPFSVEHIIPVSQGGESLSENLALACQGCNNAKYAHTWTNQFSGGNYRSYGLSTATDEVRVHRAEYFS